MSTETSQLQYLLELVKSRVGDVEAQQQTLRTEAKALKWGSIEDRINELAQRQCHGELCAFARVQGSLEAMLSQEAQ